MRVRMLRLEHGSPDGIAVVEYRAGESYDLPAHLAEAFLAMRVAEEDTADQRPAETTAARPRRRSTPKKG